jgi:methionine aminopeptidase
MDLEEIICHEMSLLGVDSAIKNVAGYKFVSTICVNNAACNQPPSANIFIRQGDLITIDIPIKIKDVVLDYAGSLVVGGCEMNCNPVANELCHFSEKINAYVAKVLLHCETIGELLSMLRNYTKENGFYLVNLPFGHVSGRYLHLYPTFSNDFKNVSIKELTKNPVIFTIEPIVSTSAAEPVLDSDGWCWKLPPGELSCYNENVIMVTKEKQLVVLC